MWFKEGSQVETSGEASVWIVPQGGGHANGRAYVVLSTGVYKDYDIGAIQQELRIQYQAYSRKGGEEGNVYSL
jgi:hypothetical protein